MDFLHQVLVPSVDSIVPGVNSIAPIVPVAVGCADGFAAADFAADCAIVPGIISIVPIVLVRDFPLQG
jgi:hypothetical protein